MSDEHQRFGKYELLELIATGGMAEIFRARYLAAAGVTKPVVIKKILPPNASNPSFVSMFVNEAKIAVGLSHGNIAQVFDFGEIDGEFYLAMELVHGQPLSKLHRRAKDVGMPTLPPPFAVLIGIELCKGLHYAHTRVDESGRPLHIVHRDVSPQNVMVSYEGQVKIVDFGIAKARLAGRAETEAGAVKGKYVYFSPEQAKGKPLDARSDVYSTGVLLYELLCGRLPIEGGFMEVLDKIVKGQQPRPRELNPALSPALEQILLGALTLEPEDRYPSAQAFGEALAAYLHSSAPTFGSSALAHLTAFLFEPELREEGTSPNLPADFRQQLLRWSAGDVWAHSAAVPRGPDRSTLPLPLPPPPVEPAPRPAPRQGPSAWLFVLVPLLTAVLAGLAVVTLGHFARFDLDLASNPPGAEVFVDGASTHEHTPLRVSGLSARTEHVIELSLPGMKPWSRTVSPAPGRSVSVNADLEPDTEPSEPTGP